MLQRAYVSVMRGARAWGRRSGWIEPLERRRDHRAWLYLRSLMAIHDVEDMARLDVPWWCLAAIARIEAFLEHRKGSAHVFEYGPGASTFWLARRCAAVSFVEHDGAWWNTYSSVIHGLENVTGRLVPPRPLERNEQPVCGSGRGGWRDHEFKDYVATIAESGGPFDLIVIDGRARAACLGAALHHLKDHGLILFDNSNRRRYRRALTGCGLALRRHRGLAPALPYPSETALLARHESLLL